MTLFPGKIKNPSGTREYRRLKLSSKSETPLSIFISKRFFLNWKKVVKKISINFLVGKKKTFYES